SGVPFGQRRSNDAHNGNYYFLYDGLGSVVGQVNSTGTIQLGITYDAWGNATRGTNIVASDLGYIAGINEWDVGTQVHFGARFYDTTIGRFTQPDPGGMRGMTYTYGANSPTSFTAPSAPCVLGLF